MGPFNKWIRGEKSFSGQEQADHILNKSISSSLSLNLKHLSKLFNGIPELITRTFPLKNGKEAALIYMEGLVDKTVINVDILRPLLFKEWNEDDFWESSISIGNIKKIQQWTDIEQSLLHGKSILFINGQLSALELDTQAAPKRSIEEPTTESSHEGFNEVASDSIALIRRYIPNRELKVKAFTVGKRAASKVFMLYLADVANEDVIQEMSCRIESIKVDAILTTGELEGFVEDNSYTLFPQLSITERPDTTAHHILNGRIAVVVDRSPGVLIGPMTFSSFFQTIDDYSFRPIIPSFIRLLRFTGLFIAIFAPALYIAMISFHYEVIPLKLLLTIGESRAKIPFPPILEALLMELVLEMLREAAVRLPGPVGQTIGVVGGIVIGQAAVQAGIVSNVMVIVVSITAVASFIIPNMEMSAGIRLLRFPMMIIASLFGVIGIMVGMAVIIIHILSMESLSVPYGSPFSPLFASDLKDTLIRLPRKIMKKRPLSLNLKQENRQSDIEEMEEDK
ncbi:TPA: spore germination protein GerSA [Bacillus cereus]|nr:spore germination protein GerSA [Bacillus cereus]HDR4741939.1 spore germination protein GerSA [Bacillus cereus]HDR4747250.1 spore germination protein GerSA [Bacillus cereus]HDR4753000.1 spore germination protein GerSA [Bacillus cereus]HDR4769936.1 spore germination protein GerSA [Bacillus cereus]